MKTIYIKIMIVFVSLQLIILACNEKSPLVSENNGQGNITVHATLRDSGTAKTEIRPILQKTGLSVAKGAIIITGEGMEEMTTSLIMNLDARTFQGAVNGVPTGTNRLVRIELSAADNQVLYHGENTTNVTAGKSSDLFVLMTAEHIIDSLWIVPANSEIQAGLTIQYHCFVFYFDEGLVDVTGEVSWSVSPSYAGVISNSGYFIADSSFTGNAQIRATFQGMIATAAITVTASPYVAPTALFTVVPEKGLPNAVFQFDASGSSDAEYPLSSLQVRWDWEDDGVWDTDYAYTKTATHQYSDEGIKTIRLEVKAPTDLSNSVTQQVSVSSVYETSTLTDIDGNVYQTVKIGTQWWMAENLHVTRYRNGDSLLYVANNSGWESMTFGAYCYYNNDDNNADVYGALYNGYAVTDSRNLAPEGWHIAGNEEWQTMLAYLAGSWVSGGKLKATGTDYWESPNSGATNESGFAARAGGARGVMGVFWMQGSQAFFWTPTLYDSNTLYSYLMSYNSTNVSQYHDEKYFGFSVRCVRDE